MSLFRLGMSSLLGWVLLFSAGCPRRYSDGPPAVNRLRAGHAPTPFSVEELRTSCRAGVWRLYRVKAKGRAPSYRILRFELASEAGVIVVSSMTDMKARPFGEQRRLKVLWKGLQSHASFPAGATSIRTEKHVTPAGVFECWRYDVKTRLGGRLEHKRFWFAKKLPGPPVDLIRFIDGKPIMRMTLVGTGKTPAPTPRPR